jgi:hypothetical protein
VVEPWRRTNDEATLRRLFEHAGVERLHIVTDTDTFAINSPSDWWRIVTGSALRHTVELLGEPAAADVRARCDAHIARHGITSVVTSSRYASARRRSAGLGRDLGGQAEGMPGGIEQHPA